MEEQPRVYVCCPDCGSSRITDPENGYRLYEPESEVA